MTLAEYFKAEKLPPRFAMMRHDFDRNLKRAEHGEGGAEIQNKILIISMHNLIHVCLSQV
ncbi:MAG: hypothetical protein O8C66_08940 [Candidatus Methanoperedens sp.]|nr:hypothetical protein [Candidatus Methanoperedens sp.]MCZ7370622.1 hypothetical protein [Candidatus Methanoperedens sp.]